MTLASLDVRHIKKHYGGNFILEDVSFTVRIDRISGMIGPNGAGKSTLFSIVTGFLRSDAGSVHFDGNEVTHLSPQGHVKLGMGRTFQVPREFRSLTVLENMMAAAPEQTGERLSSAFFRPRRVRVQEGKIREEAQKWLSFLKLAHMSNKSAADLSGGQRKLLELGRALMLHPSMILLDEPFAGVNPVLMGEISDMIRQLAETGIGFLIVEHNLSALSRLVEHMLVLDRGCLLAQGAPSAVLSDPAVQEAYMGGSL